MHTSQQSFGRLLQFMYVYIIKQNDLKPGVILLPSDFQAFYLPLWLKELKGFSIITNKNNESGHHCPVLDLTGNPFRFFAFTKMLAVDLSYIFFIMLRNVPSTHNPSF